MDIPFILEKALSLYAHKEAIVSRKMRFTYMQFAERVFKLANLLKRLGIKKGDRIAIIHVNGHEFLETYFAAAQLGAILNPLNYRLSAKELAFILKDSGSIVLIASKRFSEKVQLLERYDTDLKITIWIGSVHESSVLESIHYEESIENESADLSQECIISEDDIAHIYYTSGTTGLPKGVILTHKNVCTHALGTIAELELKDSDNWIHAAPLFHLADAWATFAITWVGGKHVVLSDFDPIILFGLIQEEKISITNMVPTMLNMLVNNPNIKHFQFPYLRCILSGGAPIAPELVKKIMDVFKCDYIQTYGMTETSPYLTFSIIKSNLTTLSPDEQFSYKAKTGRPFMGIRLRVVREDGTDVVPDDKEVGEIIVKGDSVSNGYWKRPDETEKSFREGWLYTGDMAVMDSEGYVNIVDRKKDIIISGGENVYSVEIENVLYSHPSILEAAVIGVPDEKWGEVITAFVVLKANKHATEDEIIEYCKQSIARYKAPKTVSFISELPKTGSGKIYKKGLKEKYSGVVR